MDFTVPLDRQTSRRPNQTYVVGGMEGSSQDDFELDRKPPGRNQENDDLSAAGLRKGGTRSRGLTVRITEQPGHGRPIQPEGASTPLDEVRRLEAGGSGGILSSPGLPDAARDGHPRQRGRFLLSRKQEVPL
jgi:hypothetical protein